MPQEQTVGAGPAEPPTRAAVIPAQRMEGLKPLMEAFSKGNAGGRGFSMNDLLKMDMQQRGMPDALLVLIGGEATDMYKMLERCNFKSPQEMHMYTDAIHVAEHGLGYAYGDINLDFAVPWYGEWIVKKLRGTVSIDGASRAEFERTTSTWVKQLYLKAEEDKARQSRGVVQ